MKIILAADEKSFETKNHLVKILEKYGYEYTDKNPISPGSYPGIAQDVVDGIQSGEYDRGICMCMSGMGVSIYCNKFPNVYAGLCHGVFDARRSRIFNGTNVLVMGGGLVGKILAEEIMLAWLGADYLEGIPEEGLANARTNLDGLKQAEQLAREQYRS
jgi:ribose 5-phosphate isomerase B